MSPLVGGAGLSYSGAALYWTTVAGDRGPGQQTRVLSDGGDAWADQHGVRLHFIQLGKLVHKAFIESFNGKFRDEFLNEHWFLTLQESQGGIEAWRREYYEERMHSTIGDLTPMEFIPTIRTGLSPHRITSLAVV